jgi:leucyl-tRNA synthetase
MEVLKKDDFCVESKQEKNCFIFYGRAENNIFTIIVGKRNGEYYLKTFYQSTKLTKTWKDLKSKIGTLPLTLPEVEKFEPSGTGESPLANIDEWVKTTCPKCNEPAKRETNTMPQWAGSSWYWLRFMDPHNLNEFCSKENEKYWGPVDLYVGGAEHAVLHLLYSRFWHKVLYDLGYVSTIEPFKSLKNQGMILAEDGEKMSKSKGNVINPDDIVKEFGADTLRVYEMFMGPFEQAKAWNTNAVEGIYKFLQRVWRLFEKQFDTIREDGTCKTGMQDDVRRLTHKTVKKVSEDIEAFKFNTAISAMMVFVNEAGKWEKLPKKTMEKFIKILAPFAPHLAEEIWHEKLGNKATIAYAAWPEWNEDLAKDEEINLAIQVNGKLRATISVSADIAKEEALKMAKENANVQKWLEGKTLVKEIFVPGKIVNLVVK